MSHESFESAMTFSPSPDDVHDMTIRRVNSLLENHVHYQGGEANEFQQELKEKLPEYREYLLQDVKYETFDDILEQVTNAKEEQGDDSEAEKVVRNMEKFVGAIKHDAEAYFMAVMAMDNLKGRAFRMEPEDYRYEMEQRDQRRRIVHNSLIDNLIAFTRYCNTAVKDVLGIEIDRSLLFSRQQLEDRKFIGAWAFDTELGHRIDSIVGTDSEQE